MGKNILGKTGYVDYNNIIEPGTDIYMLLGQRSDGKTYGALQECIKAACADGIPSAYIRRFSESLTKANIQDLCRPQHANIKKYSGGKWDSAVYRSKRFYFAKHEDDEIIVSNEPFLYCFPINTWENSKGPDSGQFAFIIFDEYISVNKYIPNEFTAFQNVLSSVMRNRGGTQLIMLGNPINQICPYFDEFDIEPGKIKQGDIIYRISRDGFKLKFVYIPAMELRHRKNAGFFSFGKEDSSITSGYWEFGQFPRLPGGLYKKAEHIYTFNIIFKRQSATAEIMVYNGTVFTFFRPANIDRILDDVETRIYSDVHMWNENVFCAWVLDDVSAVVEKCRKENRLYFSDNKTGNLISQWYNEFVRKGGRII